MNKLTDNIAVDPKNIRYFVNGYGEKVNVEMLYRIAANVVVCREIETDKIVYVHSSCLLPCHDTPKLP